MLWVKSKYNNRSWFIGTEDNKENNEMFSNIKSKHQQSAKTPQADISTGFDSKNRRSRPKTAALKDDHTPSQKRTSKNNHSR